MLYSVWFLNWRSNRKHERLGQAFCNDFIRGPWPELYYEEYDHKAVDMITEFLHNTHHWPNVPHEESK